MNKFLLLTSASILAMGVGTQAGAMPAEQSTLAELCGETVDADTAVKGTTEVITTTSDCAIELSGDAKLEIKDANIEFVESNLTVNGSGTVDIRNTWLTAQAMALGLLSGDIIIKDSLIDIEDSSGTTPLLEIGVGSGAIDLRYNDFHVLATGGGEEDAMKISAMMGDVAVVRNHFDVGDDLDVELMDGDVEVKGNTGDIGDELVIGGNNVTVKGNDLSVTGSTVDFDADDNLQVKNNNFGSPTNDPFVQGSPSSCDIKDNTPAVDTANCP